MAPILMWIPVFDVAKWLVRLRDTAAPPETNGDFFEEKNDKVRSNYYLQKND